MNTLQGSTGVSWHRELAPRQPDLETQQFMAAMRYGSGANAVIEPVEIEPDMTAAARRVGDIQASAARYTPAALAMERRLSAARDPAAASLGRAAAGESAALTGQIAAVAGQAAVGRTINAAASEAGEASSAAETMPTAQLAQALGASSLYETTVATAEDAAPAGPDMTPPVLMNA